MLVTAVRRDSAPRGDAVLHRLQRLAPITDAETSSVARTLTTSRKTPARRDIAIERSIEGEPRLLVSGWAALSRIMIDGRRQILNVVVPGEVLAMRPKRGLASLTNVSAITDVEFAAVVEPSDPRSALAEAYAIGNALHEHYLYRQVARLGRFNAYERTVDWLLEIHERLEMSGLAVDHSFPFPVTQEILADILGMTGVHVNRTLQALRRDGLLTIREGRVTLSDIDALASLVAFEPAAVVLGLPGLAPSVTVTATIAPVAAQPFAPVSATIIPIAQIA